MPYNTKDGYFGTVLLERVLINQKFEFSKLEKEETVNDFKGATRKKLVYLPLRIDNLMNDLNLKDDKPLNC